MKYQQVEFDAKLSEILADAASSGEKRLRVVSRDLHDRTVKNNDCFTNAGGDHRMPMACNAMWKIWEQQGSHDDRIICTTKSRKSSTIKIEFDTA